MLLSCFTTSLSKKLCLLILLLLELAKRVSFVGISWKFSYHSRLLTDIQTHSLNHIISWSHTNTLFLAHTLTHPLSLSLSLTLPHPPTLSLSLSFSFLTEILPPQKNSVGPTQLFETRFFSDNFILERFQQLTRSHCCKAGNVELPLFYIFNDFFMFVMIHKKSKDSGSKRAPTFFQVNRQIIPRRDVTSSN